MRQLFLAFCVTVLSAISPAHADEKQDLIDSIAKTGNLVCLDGGFALLNGSSEEFFWQFAGSGLRGGLQMGPEWTDGVSSYDKIKTVSLNAMREDRRKNGPLFPINGDSLLRQFLAMKELAELKMLAPYFKTKAGKLMWNEIFDGAICGGLLSALGKAPFPPLNEAGKSQQAALLSKATATKSHFEREFGKMSAAERNQFEKIAAKMENLGIRSVMSAQAAQNWVQRIIGASREELLPIIESIKK